MWHRKISNFPLDCHTSEIHGNVLPLMSILQKNLLPTLSWGHGTERCEHGGWPGVGNDIHTKHLVKFPPQLICCQLTGSSCEHRGGFRHRGGTSWIMWRSARSNGLITLCLCESGTLALEYHLSHSSDLRIPEHWSRTPTQLQCAPSNQGGKGAVQPPLNNTNRA